MHAFRRQRHLHATKHAVLLEQARQNITSQRNDELLAQSSIKSSLRARSFAALLGRMDEYVAKSDEDHHSSEYYNTSLTQAAAVKLLTTMNE
jgi:hypothetical protein